MFENPEKDHGTPLPMPRRTSHDLLFSVIGALTPYSRLVF